MAWLLILLSGCCGQDDPVWLPLDTLFLDGGSASLDLGPYALDDRGVETFEATTGPELIAEIDGTRLTVTPQPDWEGSSTVRLVAIDGCGNRAAAELAIDSGAPTTPTGTPASCATVLTYTSPGAPDGVAVAGAFNAWDPTADPMTLDGSQWSITLDLPPGSYPYKVVELDDGAFGATELWSCDPAAPFIQCDAGYKEPWETDWSHVCAPGVESCNSLLIVAPCGPPRLATTDLTIDRATGTIHLEVAVSAGAGGAVTPVVLLDDGVTQAAVSADALIFDASGLAPGRHTVRVQATDAAGVDAEPLYVPFWLDDWRWSDGTVYFAFVDRMANGDPSNDGSEGATAIGGAYEGGDLRGLIDLVPYLDDLGVSVLWLSNLQDNAEGAWSGDCNQTYAGYHAYWPDDAFAVEEHFGTEADLHELVDLAHARGMRVIMDWVANHVHQDHAYYAEHPEWFNDYAGCKDSVDGQLNFDRIPETCWFAPYLPDIDYAQPEPLTVMVDDAIQWARTYELDGFRVDAVKHMPHAVTWNLASAIDAEIEHTAAGGDEHFWTIGETFDSYARIRAYVGDEQLSGQFDFPLYYSVRDAFAYGTGDLIDVLHSWDTSRAEFGDATMSNFLGNHDVARFVTEAEGGQDTCDGTNLRVAPAPTDPWAYDRLNLAWTFLFTMPGAPLVYYGDELGLPGYGDPDNRQALELHADPIGVSSVDDLAVRVSANQASVLRHVAALGNARRDTPALRDGGWIEWWEEPDLIGYARTSDGSNALVVLNRSEAARDLVNGLAFAGLPQGRYEDVLTGISFTSSGDSLSVPVEARGSRVLVHRP